MARNEPELAWLRHRSGHLSARAPYRPFQPYEFRTRPLGRRATSTTGGGPRRSLGMIRPRKLGPRRAAASPMASQRSAAREGELARMSTARARISSASEFGDGDVHWVMSRSYSESACSSRKARGPSSLRARRGQRHEEHPSCPTAFCARVLASDTSMFKRSPAPIRCWKRRPSPAALPTRVPRRMSPANRKRAKCAWRRPAPSAQGRTPASKRGV